MFFVPGNRAAQDDARVLGDMLKRRLKDFSTDIVKIDI